MRAAARKVACFCEKSFEAPFPEAVDLAADAGVEEQILAGEFMAVQCPACGKRLTPEFPCLVSTAAPFPGAGSGRDVLLLPEADRVACMSGRHPALAEGHARIAIGMPELAEKVLLQRAGLDDRVVEIMKYYLLTGSAGGGAEEGELVLRCAGEEGDRLVFHISGLADGRIGIARLGRDLYGKIAADLDRRLTEEPFSMFCDPPCVSLRKAEASA